MPKLRKFVLIIKEEPFGRNCKVSLCLMDDTGNVFALRIAKEQGNIGEQEMYLEPQDGMKETPISFRFRGQIPTDVGVLVQRTSFEEFKIVPDKEGAES